MQVDGILGDNRTCSLIGDEAIYMSNSSSSQVKSIVFTISSFRGQTEKLKMLLPCVVKFELHTI